MDTLRVPTTGTLAKGLGLSFPSALAAWCGVSGECESRDVEAALSWTKLALM